MDALRLPKALLDDPRAERLTGELAARSRPLWPGGELRAVQSELGPALETALRAAFSAGRIVRGLEAAERVLAAEQQGLDHVDRTTGVARGGRVSRLLVLADDGAERFYRNVELLLRRHGPRVLALRLETSGSVLGSLLFGPDQTARGLLVEHKDAVAACLLALVSDGSPTGPS